MNTEIVETYGEYINFPVFPPIGSGYLTNGMPCASVETKECPGTDCIDAPHEPAHHGAPFALIRVKVPGDYVIYGKLIQVRKRAQP